MPPTRVSLTTPQRQLHPLADMLERFLERWPDFAVFSDLMILWKHASGRDLGPDVFVVKGLADRDAIDGSFDPVAEGVTPCLVIEVVSSSTRDMVAKDEKLNPPIYEAMGVDDHVLVYPPRPAAGRRLRLDVRRLDASGKYQPNPPGPNGWIHLRSVGLRVKVDEVGQQLVFEDVKTGERLLTSVEEETARREAEKRAEQEAQRADKAEEEVARAKAQMVVTILEKRCLPVDAGVRKRILDSRDGAELDRFLERAWSVGSASELFSSR